MKIIILYFIINGLTAYSKPTKVTWKERNHLLRNIEFSNTSSLENHNAANYYPIIYCRYKKRYNRGSNPKFRCWLTNPSGELIDIDNNIISEESPNKVELKVKYRRQKRSIFHSKKDMYTEVFGAQLLRTLGFNINSKNSSRKVVCYQCPQDPFRNKKEKKRQITEFIEASFEIMTKQNTLAYKHHKGWSFKEVNALKEKKLLHKKTRIHFEALSALMAIIVHSSNRRHQQRIICKESYLIDGRCFKAQAYVRDIGSILGAQYQWVSISKSKANLEQWRKYPVWKDRIGCTLNLLFSGTNLSHTRINISEDGKNYLLNKIYEITNNPRTGDERLFEMFENAKIYKADHKLRKKSLNLSDKEITKMWVESFKAKVAKLAQRRCKK